MADTEIPSEGGILRATLLPPSPLATVISLEDFTALFPTDLQSHARIPALYRVLQHQRALDSDFVRDNIAAEEKRGNRQQHVLVRTKLQGAGGTDGVDIDTTGYLSIGDEQSTAMDSVLYSQPPNTEYQPHTISTIVTAMDKAIALMEDEVSELVEAADQLQTQLEISIGDLSDLRYGKLGRSGLRKEIIESLKTLAAECDLKRASDNHLQA